MYYLEIIWRNVQWKSGGGVVFLNFNYKSFFIIVVCNTRWSDKLGLEERDGFLRSKIQTSLHNLQISVIVTEQSMLSIGVAVEENA